MVIHGRDCYFSGDILHSINPYRSHEKPLPLQTSRRVILLTLALSLLSVQAHSNPSRQIPEIKSKLEKNPWLFQSLVGAASDAQFHDAIIGFDYEQSREHSFISAVSVGKKVSDYFLVWPFKVVAYTSVQQFHERGTQPNGWGVTAYLKAYHSFNLSFTNFPVRLGFGNGLSYVSRIPTAEARDLRPDRSEKLIYYMDYSLQVSVKYLMGRGSKTVLTNNIKDIHVGYSVWHRSTLFGLLGESSGGINYLGLSAELSLN